MAKTPPRTHRRLLCLVLLSSGSCARTLVSPQQVSEGSVTFSVEFIDALAPSADGNASTSLQMSEAHALNRGVFWQVRQET